MPVNPETVVKSSVALDINRRRAILKRLAEPGVPVAELAGAVKLHPSTIYRMKERADAGESLVDGRLLLPGMPSKVDDLRVGWVLAYLAAHQGASCAVACRELNKIAPNNGWPETNYFGLRRRLKALPADLRKLLADGSKAMLQKTMPVGRREKYRVLELVQGDFSELPIWTVDMADGTMFKPYMTGVIDAASRVVTGLKFHKSPPDAAQVISTLRHAFLPKQDPNFPFWGVPEVFQSDNGGAFDNAQVQQAALRTGFVADTIAVGHPEQNGKIERFFGTFAHGFLVRLQGYADQSSGKHKAEQGGVIPFPVLERLACRYLLEYSATVHSEIGTTPWEKWHDLIGASSGRLFPRKHIEDGLRLTVEGDVTREGVSVDGRYYNGDCLNGLVEDRVTLLVTPDECDQIIPAYHRGEKIGNLRLANKVVDEINAGRLSRALRLLKFRGELAEKLDEMPESGRQETVKPAVVRKAVRATKPKKRGGKPSKSARLSRETC